MNVLLTGAYTDWLDTEESERLLRYQSRSFEDFLADLRALLGRRRAMVRLLRPLLRRVMFSKSPYFKNRAALRTAHAG